VDISKRVTRPSSRRQTEWYERCDSRKKPS
jgi:hypothetical protein